MTQHGRCSMSFSLSQDETWASPNLSSSGDMLKIYKVCSDFISHSTAQQGVQVGSGGMGWGGLLGGWVNLFPLQILGGNLYYFSRLLVGCSNLKWLKIFPQLFRCDLETRDFIILVYTRPKAGLISISA